MERVVGRIHGGPIITAIDAFPYWTEGSIKPQLVVRVTTSDGIVGWGEAGYTYRELAVVGAVRHLAEIAVGRNAFEIGALWQEFYRRAYFEGCRTSSAAMSAIDVALHDIKGKAFGVPVYELLGGAQRDKVECFATTTGATAQQTVECAYRLRDMGYDAIRLHILPLANSANPKFEPRVAIAETAEMTRAVRAGLGETAFIGLDFHHRLTPAETASFCSRMPSGTLDFLEEPIRAQNAEAYRALRQMVDVPFAIGEEFTSKWEFRPFLDTQTLQFARVDIANVGGLTEAMKIAGWCEAQYVDVMPHNPLGPINTAATLHYAVAIANLGLVEARHHQVHDPLSVDAHIYPDQAVLLGTAFQCPQGPGLGISVDEAALAEESARYRFGNPVRLARGDGSYANN